MLFEVAFVQRTAARTPPLKCSSENLIGYRRMKSLSNLWSPINSTKSVYTFPFEQPLPATCLSSEAPGFKVPVCSLCLTGRGASELQKTHIPLKMFLYAEPPEQEENTSSHLTEFIGVVFGHILQRGPIWGEVEGGGARKKLFRGEVEGDKEG